MRGQSPCGGIHLLATWFVLALGYIGSQQNHVVGRSRFGEELCSYLFSIGYVSLHFFQAQWPHPLDTGAAYLQDHWCIGMILSVLKFVLRYSETEGKLSRLPPFIVHLICFQFLDKGSNSSMSLSSFILCCMAHVLLWLLFVAICGALHVSFSCPEDALSYWTLCLQYVGIASKFPFSQCAWHTLQSHVM